MDEALRNTEEVGGPRDDRPPITEDQNVTITLDGRRIDTREKALAWVDELNALPREGPLPLLPPGQGS